MIFVSSNFIRVYFIIRDGFNKKNLMEFYLSCVYSCNLKCGTCVFGEPNKSYLCSSCWIAITLSFCKVIVFLDKLWCRLLNLVLVVFFLIGFSDQKKCFLISFVFCVSFAIRSCVYSNVWFSIFIMEIIS